MEQFDIAESWLSAGRRRIQTAHTTSESSSAVHAVQTSLFSNPSFLDGWAKEAQVDLGGSLDVHLAAKVSVLLDGSSETFRSLSKRQNATWATKMVVEGINFAQQKQFANAIAKYTHAIEVNPNCVDAFVARGAAFANQLKLDEAIADHTHALQLAPSHVNAKIYLEKCLAKKKEIDDEKQSALEGAFLMPMDSSPRQTKIPFTKNPEFYGNDMRISRGPATTASVSNQSLSSSNEFELILDDVVDFVEAPPPDDSRHKKRKKEKKGDKKKKKSSKEKKRRKRDESSGGESSDD
ncbi:hypothetical protein HDU84_000419 [Entophlyctis sp. JEL0112]|nr:hypothetical protein HDU84_000419 [Entophlyctis sp. JEL0112]